MTKAEELYTGDEGAQYWERNGDRLRRESIDRQRALRSLIPDEIIRDRQWLEVGCGRGDNLCYHDVGLDCDPRQLDAMIRWYYYGKIAVLGHAYDLSMFIDGSFEVVFSVGCLMHLPTRRLVPGVISPGTWWNEDIEDETWQRAVEEMARVSRRYVILGEYWAEQEEPVEGKHWEGCLWRRPYNVPGFRLVKGESLEPFDADVLFTVWQKV